MHNFVLSTILREIRQGVVYIVFYTLVIALLISAFVSLVSVMAFLPNEFMAYYTDTAGVVDARIAGDNGDIAKVLDESTIVYYEKDGVTYNVDISSSSGTLHLPDYLSGRCFDFNRHNAFFVDRALLDGNIPKVGEIMLAQELATYLGVGNGDIVSIADKKYTVSGIYDIKAVPFKASFMVHENLANMDGGDKHIIVDVNRNTPYMYTRFLRYGVDIEDNYNFIGLYSSLISIILVVVMCTAIVGVSSAVIFTSLIKYLLLKRQKTMYMILSLGAEKMDVVGVYVGIFSIISLVGNALGMLGGYGLVTYFGYLFESIIGMRAGVPFLWYVPIVVMLLFVGIAIISTTTFLGKKSIRIGLSEVDR